MSADLSGRAIQRAMIELKDVTKAYRVGSKWRIVLDDVSFVFPTGVSVGVLGLNGAGKSTLLRLVGGIEPPDHGKIYRDVRVSWPIGFSGGLHRGMTGRENARFISRLYGGSPGKIERFTEEFTELGIYFDMPIKTYSSGMKARLAFAISMASEFDCYLVDEVIAVGDKRFNLKYRRAFRERLANATVIMVSHSAETIRQECDMGAILHNGQLELFESVDRALEIYENELV